MQRQAGDHLASVGKSSGREGIDLTIDGVGRHVLDCFFHSVVWFDDVCHRLISFSFSLLIKLTYRSHVLKCLAIVFH